MRSDSENPSGPVSDGKAAEEQAPNSYSDPESLEIIRQHGEQHRNLGTLAIAAAATRHGARLQWLSGRDVWATFEDRRIPIAAHCATESSLSTAIVADKTLAKELMERGGVRVPSGRLVTSAADTVAAQQDLGRPVVVKPRYGLQSRGVTVNVTEPRDLEAAYRRARQQGRDVLVEEFVDGLEYRVHANDRECVGVFRRILPNVMGDGSSTIAELVRAKNEFRKKNPSTTRHPIPMDDVAEGYLRRRGMSWDSVIDAGQRIVVRDVNGITSGGDSVECFDTASAALKQIAVDAVAAIPGMDWAGADILVERSTGDPYVMEINTDAAINGSTFPVYGTPRDLGGLVWQQKYANSRPEISTEPLVAQLVETPQPISTRTGRVDLFGMLVEDLKRRDYTVQARGGRIISASHNGVDLWFSGCTTGSDLLLSHRHLRRYMQQRQTLRRQGVPRPPARRIRDVEQLETFRAEHSADVALLKVDGHQPGGVPRVIGAEQSLPATLPTGQDSWCVQVRPAGLRLRVAATEEAALTVVAAPEDASALSPRELSQASRVAVRAVRAVPQLRWAVVDVVIPADVTADTQEPALVEMMSIRPEFESTDLVLAGALDDILDVIIQGAAQWTPTEVPSAQGSPTVTSVASKAPIPKASVLKTAVTEGAPDSRVQSVDRSSEEPVAVTSERRAAVGDAADLAQLLGGTWTRMPEPQWRPEALLSVRRVLRRGRRVQSSVLTSSKDPLRSLKRLAASDVDPHHVALLVPDTGEVPDSAFPMLRVPDVDRALEQVSQARRALFQGTVLAVTGSVGKTTVSRLLAHTLGAHERTHIARTTHNDLLTARANLFSLSDEDSAVFEVSRLGLPGAERILAPKVVVVTAIAEAHLEDFGTMEDTARAKSQLLRGLDAEGVAVINIDAPHSDVILNVAREQTSHIITYGTSESADVRLLSYEPGTGAITASCDGDEFSYSIGMTGEHNALNSLAAIAVLKGLGRDRSRYMEAIAEFAAVEGRGETQEMTVGGRRVTLVDESFNANPTSMRATIEGFGRRYADRRRILVLGDMQELGPDAAEMHGALADAVARSGAEKVFLMGPLMSSLWAALDDAQRGAHMMSVDQLLAVLPEELQEADAVLVKSSHSTGLDRVVKAWAEQPSPQSPRSWRLVVSGPAVQGVGYRRWIRDEAQRRQLDGWVRNRSDGRVEMLMHGNEDTVRALIAAAHTGPPRASVDRVTSRVVETVPESGFRQRPTRTIRRTRDNS